MIGRLRRAHRRALARRRTVGATLSGSLLSTAIVVAAVQSDGSTATVVELDDATVWVTNDALREVGRLNTAIDELDLSVVGSDRPDVLQDGRSVFISGRLGGVQRLDPITERLTNPNEIVFEQYAIGGGVGAVLNPDDGALWVGNDLSVVGAQYPERPDARVAPGSRLVVTRATRFVDVDGQEVHRGKVIVIGPDGWYDVHLDGALRPLRAGHGEPSADSAPDTAPATTTPSSETADREPEPEPLYLPDEPQPLGVSLDEIDQVAAVGAVPVVLTHEGELAWSDPESGARHVVAIDGEEWSLQQTGPDAAAVLVASDTGLFEIPLAGDDPQPIELVATAGIPSAPVRLDASRCVYGAWSSATPVWFKRCPSGGMDDVAPVPNAGTDAHLVWRVNRRTIALNDTGDGEIWADHDGQLAQLGNWDDVRPSSEEDRQQETVGQSEVEVEPECLYERDDPPTAGADELGVRPRQSVIDLLHNDHDVNCDPLAITALDPDHGEWGSLTVIDNGQRVLYSPSQNAMERAADAALTFTFTYQAVDTDELTSAPAQVAVTVRDVADGGNAPPGLRPKGDETRRMATQVEAGKQVAYDVMPDWWDPNGDDLRLVSAVVVTDGEVTATPEGVVSFAAFGVDPGVYEVEVTMTDGLLEATEMMEVTVKPIGSVIPPEAADDFTAVPLGRVVTVSPLDNDTDGNDDELTLQPKWSVDGTLRVRVLPGHVVEIEALQPGVHQLAYSASDGTSPPARASIRVEVPEPSDVSRAPVAVPDHVTLRPNRIVNVDVLGNDVDPDADVLGVVDVDVAGADPELVDVRATVIDRRMLQVEVVPGTSGKLPEGRFDVYYTVSDGFDDLRAEAGATAEEKAADGDRARGRVTLLVQPPGEDRPPEPHTDRAVVRAGGVVQIPVLRNDTDPDNDEIELRRLTPESLAQFELDSGGVAWVEGRNVFVWGHTPRPAEPYSLTYEVEAFGQRTTGEIELTVTGVPDDDHPNQPPEPTDLVLRAVRNATVRLEIPSSGIDPDGDTVTVTAVGAPQNPGNSTSVDGNVIAFVAGPGREPTDEFTYTVTDAHGDAVERTVRVLVLPQQAWPPVAHDDVWRAAPGRTLTIDVLANDVSPQDIEIGLADLPFYDLAGAATGEPLNSEHVALLPQDDETTRGFVSVVVPTQTGTLVEQYAVVDAQGRDSKASIRVTPDEDAPNMAPIARPDADLRPEDVKGLDTVSVPVYLNDYDPDGDAGDLVYELAPFQRSDATMRAGVLTIPVEEFPQTILYKVTDEAGDYAIGLVRIPDSANHAPELSAWGTDPNARVVEASSPEPVHVSLADAVFDPDGDPVRLTEREIVLLQNAPTGERRVQRDADGLGFTYDPPAELTSTTTVWIQFQVTDEPELTAEERQTTPRCNCESLLSIAIVIEAQSPPVIVGPGAITVPRIDEPVTYDVTALSYDREGDPLTYEFATDGLPLMIEPDGATLRLVSDRPEEQLPPLGAQYVLPYTVWDGNPAWEPLRNTVTITIGDTNAPPPVAGTLGPYDDVVRDRPYAIPDNLALAGFNPFGDARPLELIEWSTTHPGQISCTNGGDCTFVTDQVGQFIVNYTLRDDAGRLAQGSFTIGVRGAPTTPGIPQIRGVSNHAVRLSWVVSDPQLGPNLRYVVSAEGEDGSRPEPKISSTNSVEFGGLRNAVAYRFTVVAVNDIGESEAAGPSGPGVPDRVPDPPASPAFTDYGDGQVSLRWAPPTTAGDFSAIERYHVELIGGPTLEPVPGNQTSLTVTGLTNGQEYTFRVQAENATGRGGWSVIGRGVGDGLTSGRPSRAPDAPAAPSARNTGDGGTPRLTVTWAAPGDDGGRPVVRYRVCMSGGACQTVAAPTTQATFDAVAGAAPTFTVAAINTTLAVKGNESPAGPASAPVTALQRPPAPGLSVSAPASHTIQATATAQGNAGCTQQFEYRIRDVTNGAVWSPWTASGTWNNRVNGHEHQVEARAFLPASCGETDSRYESGPSAPASATPYGPLVAPNIYNAVVQDRQYVLWQWAIDSAANNDSGRNWTARAEGACGPASSNMGQSQYRSGPHGYSVPVYCRIIIEAPGAATVEHRVDRTTQPPPIGSVGVSVGSTASGGTCSDNQGCYWIAVTLSGWEGTHTVRCYGRNNASTWDLLNTFTAGNGTHACYAYSYAGRTVIASVDCDIAGQSANNGSQSCAGGAYSGLVVWPTN